MLESAARGLSRYGYGNLILEQGRQLERVSESLVKRCTRLINAGRRVGTIPVGPPARAVALAFIGAMTGAVIELAGQAPHDELLAARAAAGVLGLDHSAIPKCD